MEKKTRIYGIKFGEKVIYVGQTSVSVDQRFLCHLRFAKNGGGRVPKLYEHMRSNNFTGYTFFLIEFVKKENKNEREKHWVSFYDTQKNGCNTTSGGITAKGPDHYLYGKPACAKAVAASVAARTGKKLSPEHIEKIRAGNKGKKQPQNYVKVMCVETGVIYESLKHAGEAFGTSGANIYQNLCGNSKTAKGHTFKRIGES